MRTRERTYYLYSLGCPKNLIDSELLSGGLLQMGWKATPHPDEAEIILINTCAFIESAVRESIDAIMTLHEEAPEAKLVVTGCLPWRYGRQLQSLLPEVALFFCSRCMDMLDARSLRAVIDGTGWIEHPCGLNRGEPRIRQLSTPFYTAYVKISDGCNRRCAFCTLPRIRGRYRSRPMETIEKEVVRLVSQGVREVILVAQDAAAYGQDLGAGETLAGLLDRLAVIPGLVWLKLLYLYPDIRRVDAPLIEVYKRHVSLCPVIDLPIQHISPRVLRRMRRPSPKSLKRILHRLQGIPGIRLRTTLMVGFPGETEEDFRELCGFVEEGWFDHLGVFTYSDEEETPAASFPDKVPEAEKQRRMEILMEIQRAVSHKKNQGLVGQILPVLVEGPHEETELLLRGRTAYQFPEIDGCVLLTRGEAEIGEIVPVRITGAGDYDLVGEIVSGKD